MRSLNTKKIVLKNKHKEAIKVMTKGRKILRLTKDQLIDNLTITNKGLTELVQVYVDSTLMMNKEYTDCLSELEKCGCHEDFLNQKIKFNKESEH